MPTFSTDDLPPRDRFAYWREVVAQRALGIEVEIEAERRLDFTGRLSVSAVGPASLTDTMVSAHTMRTTRRTIDQQAGEGGEPIWYLVHGGGSMIAADRAERVDAGTLMTGCGNAPATYRPDLSLSRPGGCSGFRGVMIPRSVLATLPVAPGGLLFQQHRSSDTLGALLHSYLATFVEQAPRLSGPAAEHAVRILAQLVLAAHGATDIRDEAGAAALREALLTRAHRLIEQELHRPDLSPARVASRLGISVRKLHLVFEPSGVSFGRHLLARRMARADRLLREAPHLSVTQAAFAVGIESLSTFFRGYRATYGMSPSERRGEAGQTRG